MEPFALSENNNTLLEDTQCSNIYCPFDNICVYPYVLSRAGRLAYNLGGVKTVAVDQFDSNPNSVEGNRKERKKKKTLHWKTKEIK